MTITQKNKTVHFKHAQFSDPSLNLQSVLSAAINTQVPMADDRRERFSEDEETFRIINRHENYSGMMFGQFLLYEPGRRQPLVSLGPDQAHYPVAASDPGKNRAFADEFFYFGVMGDDLVVAQTRSLRSRELEVHLNWLLKTCCKGLVGDDVTIMLIDRPTEEAYQKASAASVKSVKIGSPVFAAFENGNADNETSETTRMSYRLAGRTARIIHAIIGEEQFDRLRFEDDLDEANLRVFVEFSFLRKTTNEGHRALDELASSFRHIEESDYEVKLVNGTSVKGGEMKISGKVTLRLNDNGLVDEHDLYNQMHVWLHQTLLDGE